MQRSTQLALAREILRHIDMRTTAISDAVVRNPTAVYTEPELLRREIDILFRRQPLLLGLSCQLPNPGDYLTDDLAGVPVLVVRREDGSIAAFLNVCRHRGAKLVHGAGHSGRHLVCPYHAWSYRLDGSLAGMPAAECFAGIGTDRRALVALPAVEKYGMIWVRPSPGPEIDIDAHLAGLGPELAGYDCAGYTLYESRQIERRMNWKIVIDTFLEPYHFAPLHRDTVAPIFIPNLCLFHAFGPNLRETLPRRSIEQLRDLPQSDWDLITHTAIVYVLFPNTVFVMQADHIELWRVFPAEGRADRAIMSLDFYIPEPAVSDSARRHWQRNMGLVIKTVQEEDFPTGEGMQQGFMAEAQSHVAYGRNEPALAHFQASVRAALAHGGDASRAMQRRT
jgi:nitrite reductase/ring-hydroxylating ferredoxin subunit